MKAIASAGYISIRPDRRRGIAAIWTLVVLAVLTGMMTAVTAQLMSNRRWLDQRQNQMQSVWLARAGVELAADRLMTKPANYTGETVELIPAAQVRIEVRREPASPNTFVVTSEARYPTDGRPVVVRSVTSRLRRTIEKDQVHIEFVIPDAPVLDEKGTSSR